MIPDVIIAIIPAKGHEGLVEAGERIPNHPAVRVERPMTISRCMCGAYACKSHYLDGHGYALGKGGELIGEALVLFAPGGPRLGMVRLQKALHPYLASVDRSAIAAPPDFEARGFEFCSAWAGAHAAKQRGLASEVLVLPVTS